MQRKRGAEAEDSARDSLLDIDKLRALPFLSEGVEAALETYESSGLDEVSKLARMDALGPERLGLGITTLLRDEIEDLLRNLLGHDSQ